jgi:ubiquinone/menaquinone biosynthesis C-methylase UbiE
MGLLPIDTDPRTNFFYVAQLRDREIPPDMIELLLSESRRTYEDETEIPFLDLYFRHPVRDLLRHRSLLDLGCSVGGRSVRLAETLQISRLSGVDILPSDVEVARRFAASRGIDGDFRAGRAEALPFESETIDNIVSYDAFEHVENPEAALGECLRVLVPGGHVVAVFPPFRNPFESHLLFSEMPALHWFLSGELLAKAQRRIALSKGWSPDVLPDGLASWEKLPSLNGLSRKDFVRVVDRTACEVVYLRSCPLFTTGRRAQKNPLFRLLRQLCRPLVFVPGVREYATDRVACVLRKPQSSTGPGPRRAWARQQPCR